MYGPSARLEQQPAILKHSVVETGEGVSEVPVASGGHGLRVDNALSRGFAGGNAGGWTRHDPPDA